MTPTEFRFYLDEMVGLGVLVKDPVSQYTLRSPNIVTMMGTGPSSSSGSRKAASNSHTTTTREPLVDSSRVAMASCGGAR